MPTSSDHDTSPLGFDPAQLAAGGAPDEHPTLVTPRPTPEPGADDAAGAAGAAWNDDVLPAEGGRRARRLAQEDPKRAPLTTPTPLGRAVLPVLLAVLCVAALWGAWTHLQDKQAASAAPAPTRPTSDAASPAPSRVSPSPVASSTPAASTAPSSAPATSAAASRPATSAPAVVATARPVDRRPPVVVYNATNRAGLARTVARQLEAKGWKVVGVGNWTRTNVPRTSLYLIGHLDAQATMKRDFPYAKGPFQDPLPGMPAKTLVVVIGDDYPG